MLKEIPLICIAIIETQTQKKVSLTLDDPGRNEEIEAIVSFAFSKSKCPFTVGTRYKLSIKESKIYT